jgi:hypothetical protein
MWSAQRVPPIVTSIFYTWSRYYFFQVVPQIVHEAEWTAFQTHCCSEKSGNAGNRTRGPCVSSQKLLTTRPQRRSQQLNPDNNLESSCISVLAEVLRRADPLLKESYKMPIYKIPKPVTTREVWTPLVFRAPTRRIKYLDPRICCVAMKINFQISLT